MNRRKLIMLTLPLVYGLLWGCERPSDVSQSANVFQQLQRKTLTKRIAATSYPLVAMARSITGKGYEVLMPAKANKIPTPEEMRALQSCDVLLTNGPGTAYATWLPMVTLDEKKIFETTTNSFELSDFIRVHEHQIVHSHGGEGEHSHAWMVPHCWLDPRLAVLQAKAVCDKLCELYPEDAESFRANFAPLEKSLHEASKEAKVCRDLIEAEKVILLLNDPRLKHFGKSVGVDADSLLWFEPKELPVARQELQERIAQLPTGGQPLFLWGRGPTVLERDLMVKLKWAQLDLIESPQSDKGVARRIKDNFNRLADGIRESVDARDGSQ